MHISSGLPILLLWLFLISLGFLLNLMDGWRLLAEHYRTSQQPSGKKWNPQKVNFSLPSRRSDLLFLTTNADGLFIESFWRWRPPLFIPWQDFHNAVIENYMILRVLDVQVGDPCIAKLRLSPEVFEQSEGRKVLSTARYDLL